MANLCENLVKLRTEKKLLQKDVAKAIGMSVIGYQRYEYGTRNPTSDILLALCNFYDVSADWILGRTSHDYLTLLEEAEDEYLLALALERKKNSSGKSISWEEHLSKHSITQEELDAMEDVELEYELPN